MYQLKKKNLVTVVFVLLTKIDAPIKCKNDLHYI